MPYSYWISFQFKLPDGRDGYGDMDLSTAKPLDAKSMPFVRAEIKRVSDLPTANIVVLAISRFES